MDNTIDFNGALTDALERKATNDGENGYKLYIKHNGEFVFTGYYSRQEVENMDNIILN